MERSSMPVPSSSGASMGKLRLVDSRPICVATSATSAGSRMLRSRAVWKHADCGGLWGLSR